jgi:ribosomal protein S18 acetylase RimI-like enzyme
MNLEILYDKEVIFGFLKKNKGLHIYSIGDLDDFFWKKTTWFALREGVSIYSIALLYTGMEIPTLLLFHEGQSHYPCQLLEWIKPLLPAKFYAHFSTGLLNLFKSENIRENYGLHYKMVLNKVVSAPVDENIRNLTPDDLDVINEFYSVSYPHNWFDGRMLETNKYFGYFESGRLIGAAGVHVFSERYKVAALGNIATHPDYRGKQIAYKLTSALCYNLQQCVDLIGLNVKADNENAIKCYRKIGFEVTGTYEECYLKNNIV